MQTLPLPIGNFRVAAVIFLFGARLKKDVSLLYAEAEIRRKRSEVTGLDH